MGLKLKRGLKLFFQKKLRKLSLIVFLHFFLSSLIYNIERKIYTPPICASNNTKITQFG
jgi:hypothetical protein